MNEKLTSSIVALVIGAGVCLAAPCEAGAVECAADVDGDGMVAFGDLTKLLSEWDCVGCATDLDGDGTTGFTDLSVLLAQWGSCP